MHTPCTETEFVKKYNESTCSESLETSVYPAIAVPSFQYCNRLDEIIKDYNTSDFWDPHQCSKSCHDPSYGCLACTNSAYFKCTKNKLEVCIHPELHCNHHPDCDNAEDEKFEDCKDKYVEKFIVKEFATLRCPSKMYQNMDTVATVCDDNIECYNKEDEPDSCKKNDGNMYMAISVFLILSVYLG